MSGGKKLRAGVLSTVIVVSVLMAIIVLGVIAIWDNDFLLMSRNNYILAQRANIESTLLLYHSDPAIADRLAPDSTLLLFDSIPSSTMRFHRKPWGLFELVTVESADGKVWRVQLNGLEKPDDRGCNFWYRNNNSMLTLTGFSNIKGTAAVPSKGIVYGQMQSIFFSGEKLAPSAIKQSGEMMPEKSAFAKNALESLFALTALSTDGLLPDSLTCGFHNREPKILDIGSGTLSDCYYAGNIILIGKKITIEPTCELHNIIIIGENITVEDHTKITAQLFARDTIELGEHVALEYPSGVYARSYAQIGDYSAVDGYFIVETDAERDVKKPDARKSRLSKIRGLFYNNGITQFQGIVSGAVYLNEAVYYSPHGYYNNMIYDATVLENRETAYPLWLHDRGKRKGARYVQ